MLMIIESYIKSSYIDIWGLIKYNLIWHFTDLLEKKLEGEIIQL